MASIPPASLFLKNKTEIPTIIEEIGAKYNVANHLICIGTSQMNIQYHHLRLRNGELELIFYTSMSPMLGYNYDVISLFILNITQPTIESTNNLIEAVRLYKGGFDEIATKHGITALTEDNLESMKVDGVLKVVRCIID
jgi:hypothetical protein